MNHRFFSSPYRPPPTTCATYLTYVWEDLIEAYRAHNVIITVSGCWTDAHDTHTRHITGYQQHIEQFKFFKQRIITCTHVWVGTVHYIPAT